MWSLWILSALVLGAPQPTTPQGTSESGAALEALTILSDGLDDQPIPVFVEEGTVGRLELGANEAVNPVLASDDAVFVALAPLGKGRVVAFGGQDFFGPDATSSFVGLAGNDRLVANAVRWVAGTKGDQAVVLVDNEHAAEALSGTLPITLYNVLLLPITINTAG